MGPEERRHLNPTPAPTRTSGLRRSVQLPEAAVRRGLVGGSKSPSFAAREASTKGSNTGFATRVSERGRPPPG